MLKRNTVLLLASVFWFPGIAASKTVVVSVSSGSGSGTAARTATRTTGAQPAGETWTATYNRPNVVVIPLDDLNIPIQTAPATLTLSNETRGRLIFSAESVRAVTRTPVVTYTHTGGTAFSRRPTLLVSLCGFMGSYPGSGTCDMQYKLERHIANTYGQYQYKHFAVDWETYLTNVHQVRDLANTIGDFLKPKAVPWDVVIVGFSRGGVFAHDLARALVGHTKIDTLHTYLLDPTGSPAFSDVYPASKPTAPGFAHHGFNYYDNRPWVDAYLTTTNATTESDRPISGYNNNYFDATLHAAFPGEWIDAHMGEALAAINQVKDVGSFPEDGTSGMEIVTISSGGDVDFNGSIDFVNGTAHISGSLTISGVPGSVSLEATVGADGVQISGAQGAAVGQLIADADRVYVSQSVLVSNYVATLDSSGISADVTMTHILDSSTSVDISTDGSIDITLSIGGESVSVDINPFDPGGVFDW